MKVFKELALDSLVYGASNFLGRLIGFFLLPLYTQYLSTFDYGIIAMMSFITIFYTPLSSMGITNAIFKVFNREDDPERKRVVLSSGAIAVTVNAVILFLLGYLLADFLTYLLVDDKNYRNVFLLALSAAFFTSISAVFSVVLRANRKVLQIGLIRIVELLLTVGFTIYYVVYLREGLIGVFYGSFIGTLAALILSLILCRSFLVPKFSRPDLKEMLAYGLPFLPHRLLTYGSGFAAQYIMKVYLGVAAVGVYDVAVRFAVPLAFIVGSVQSAWVPIKFQIHKEEGENGPAVFRRVITTYLFVILFLFTSMTIFVPEVVLFLMPEEFHAAAQLMPYVLLVHLARSFYFMLGTGFDFTTNTKPLPLVSGAGFVIMIGLGIIGIKYFGTVGAVLSVSLSWITMATMIRYFSIRRYYIPLNFKGFAWNGVVSVVSIIASVLIYTSLDNFWLRIGAEIIAFLGISVWIALIVRSSDDFKSLNLGKYPVFGKLNGLLIKLGAKA